MKRMIFATGNENKMKEIREILGDLPLEILSMKRQGFLQTLRRTEQALRRMR